jgi:CheY-like chemotaxis protein
MGSILVIDDEFALAEVLKAIIEEDCHEVRIASGGRSGLR